MTEQKLTKNISMQGTSILINSPKRIIYYRCSLHQFTNKYIIKIPKLFMVTDTAI